MDVLNQILQESAIGNFSRIAKSLIVSLFITIVMSLMAMLTALIINGNHGQFYFGY